MSQTKCSYEHLLEYNEAVKIYLKDIGGITDFTQFETTIKDGILHFTTWNYPNMQQPTNIIPKQKAKTFLPCNIGIVLINMDEIPSTHPADQPVFINVNGDIVPALSVEEVVILGILAIDFELPIQPGRWITLNSLIGWRFNIENGLLRFDAHKEKIYTYKKVPRLRITVCFTNKSISPPSTVFKQLEEAPVVVEKKIIPVKIEPKIKHGILYMIPKDIDTQQQQ